MAGYTNIRNSTANANSNYFTNAGSSINASNQPNIDDFTLAGVQDASLGANLYGLVSTTKLVSYTGNDRTTIMMGTVNTLKGSPNNALRDPAAVPPTAISIPKMTALRTTKVVTAIRAGAWNEISGGFYISGVAGKIPLAVTNDFAAVGTDNIANSSRSNPGQITFNYDGGLPSTTGYPSRTS